MDEENRSRDEQAACAALLVLRAILPDGASVDPDRVMMLPEHAILTDAEAAVRLAGMVKPVECEPEVHSGTLAVGCREISEENKFLHDGHIKDLEQEGGFLVGKEGLEALRTSGGSILLVGREGESMLLDLSEFQQFERDYLMVGNCLGTADHPTPEQDARGAAWVIKFGSSQGRTFRIEVSGAGDAP